MSATPRATPVVQPPLPKTTADDAPLPKQLKAPIVVVAGGSEWEHDAGDFVIGRDAEANAVLEDPLVSRFHARLCVGPDGRVTLEDLHSANGVFVNGCKLSRPSTLLGEGDRLLIGTTEVSVFSMRASAQVRLGKQISKMPSTAAAPMPGISIEERSTLRSAQSEKEPQRRNFAVTGRSDALTMVGQFAEQLMQSGHPLEAARVLSEHLQNLLKGASAGLNVPTRILDNATRYAVLLHEWTQRATWLEYVLELHLAAHQIPTNASLDELQIGLKNGIKLDPVLIRYFLTTIEVREETPTPEERLRLQRIEMLGR